MLVDAALLAVLAALPLAPLASALTTSGTYDYVIVGGGTAGAVLANRLTEDPKVSVALIEPGTWYQISNFILGSTPAGSTFWSWGNTNQPINPLVDWGFITEPQKGCNNRNIRYARGKCLGGSSARNYMLYHKPDKGSLDLWADVVGDPTYRYDAFDAYYRKSTTWTAPKQPPRAANATVGFDTGAYGPVNGPLQISYPNYAQPISSWLIMGLNYIGIPTIPGLNSGNLLGTQYSTSTISPWDEKRSSSQTAYLDSAKNRRNLSVFQLTKAQRIIFEGKRAVGVQLKGGKILGARREVLLTAGAFHSPQILMLSGIGPPETLAKFNIPLVHASPGVGQNMTDHVLFGPAYRVRVETWTKWANNILATVWEFLTEYLIFKRGPFTNPSVDLLAFEKTPRDMLSPAAAAALDAAYPPSWPEIEFFISGGTIMDASRTKGSASGQPTDGYNYASVIVGLQAAMSRGTVTLKSGSIDDLPAIDPQWLTHPVDQEVALAAFKRARAVWQAPPVRPVLYGPEYYPGEEVATDEQIANHIRNQVTTIWHAATTNRMGRPDDPTAVVDTSCRVYGVEGLRVVDASAFALLPPGHPQSTVYALAEKIADLIKRGL
ncbi:hypothetical protein Q8F55_004597 [Vanrija albida]|uniref:Glucose-methanol-choline oxidoreductase N-terminal domain-containing protein n=1 Tax=Vanrija albida TaxID=181172 RepID=A0ABR3Q784_9TREE